MNLKKEIIKYIDELSEMYKDYLKIDNVDIERLEYILYIKEDIKKLIKRR